MGNDTGMRIFDDLRDLRKDLEKTKNDLGQLRRERFDELLPLRVTTLNEWSSLRQPTDASI